MRTAQKPPPSEWAANVRQQVLTWPNLVTTIRLICAMLLFFQTRNAAWVFWLALVGSLSDIVDGWLAKRFGLGTEFGKTYDQWTDWCFGVALLYAIYVAGHGVTWNEWPYNGLLVVLIGSYLLLRTLFPRAETVLIAKVKTAMQFGGGVAILAGYAGASTTLGAHTFSSADFLDAGYLLAWVSIGLMGISLGDYIQGWLTK